MLISLITATVLFAWGILQWVLMDWTYPRKFAAVVLTLTNAALVLFWHPEFRQSASSSYSGDSIHTLTATAAAGLVAITALLILFTLILSWQKSRVLLHIFDLRFRISGFLLDLCSTIMLFWLCISVVPQIHYLYYRRIFFDLPQQLVIDGLLPFTEVVELAVPKAGGSLADHATGLVLWVLILNVVGQWIYHYHQTRRSLSAVTLGLLFYFSNILWQSAKTAG